VDGDLFSGFRNCYILLYFQELLYFQNEVLNVSLLYLKNVFSASLLRSSVSHDPLEIILMCWFGTQERHFLL